MGRGARRSRTAGARAVTTGSRSASTPRSATPRTTRTATPSHPGTGRTTRTGAPRWRPRRPVPGSGSSASRTGTARRCATSASSACAPGVVITDAGAGAVRRPALDPDRRPTLPLGGPLTRLVHGQVLDDGRPDDRHPGHRSDRRTDPRARRAAPDHPVRAGLRRGHRLRRPGELRHQLLRRRRVRLPAALGDRRGQPAGHAHPDPVGQARPGHRAQPARAVPGQLPALGVARHVGAGRAGGHRHRPGRGDRRRDRAEPAVRDPAVHRRSDHRDRRVRAAGPAEPRLPAVRAGHHRAVRGDPDRLPEHRAAHRPGPGRPGGRPGPALRRHRQPAAGHRHPGRHRHAARDLPALGADPAPDPGARRSPTAATCSATSRWTCWSGWAWPAWSTRPC